MTQEWTAERAAALIAWWNEALRASEIGRRLSVTKNAVIGKAFRLQLAKRRPSSPARSDDGSVIRLVADTGGGNVQLAPGRDPTETAFTSVARRLFLGNPTCRRTAD